MTTPAGNGRPRQIALALEHPVRHHREDIVVSPANAAAMRLVDLWPDWPAPVVVIVGPRGSGKTHMAEVWHQESGATRLAASAIGGQAGEVRGPVLIDPADVEGLDEAGLFHLINVVRETGTNLLLTGRRAPAAWGVTLPDLASRLRAATTVELREPDDMLLEGVITKLFADRQLVVEPHVVQYLLRRMERSLAAATEIVERLDRAALEQKTRITRGLAAALLDDHPPGNENES
jgi:chromosomal replication initiation ATPase DnaA